MAICGRRILGRTVDGGIDGAAVEKIFVKEAAGRSTRTSGEGTQRQDGRSRRDGHERDRRLAVAANYIERWLHGDESLLRHGCAGSLERYRRGIADRRRIGCLGAG